MSGINFVEAHSRPSRLMRREQYQFRPSHLQLLCDLVVTLKVLVFRILQLLAEPLDFTPED